MKPSYFAVALALLIAYAAYPFADVAAQAAAQASARQSTAYTVTVGNLNRTYYLYVPSNASKDRPSPLVLMFHGGGGMPAYAEKDSKFSELAEREGFLVAYPQGFEKSWNDGRGDTAVAAQRDNIDDVAFVGALIDDISKHHNVDSKRVYATGISNGAMFSHYLAAKLSSRIAAIAPVVGGMPEPLVKVFNPEGAISVLIFNGTADPLVPYQGGDITAFGKTRGRIISTDGAAKKWATQARCDRDPIQQDVIDKNPNDQCIVKKISYGNCQGGAEVIVYRMEGGGHTWPNGAQYLPERLIGPVCRELNGSELIWDFFKRHAKP